MGNALAFGAYLYLDRDSLVGCRLPFFCLRIPANKVTPGSTVPGCRAKEKINQWIMFPNFLQLTGLCKRNCSLCRFQSLDTTDIGESCV